MKAKLQAVLVSALALMVVSPVLHAQHVQYPSAYCWEAAEEQKAYYSKIFPTGEGQEREVCYETKVKCEGDWIFGIAEWNVLRYEYPPGHEVVIPWFSWRAASGDWVEFCGNTNEWSLQIFANVKEWSTSCEFYDGSKFSAKITEVDPAKCGIED